MKHPTRRSIPCLGLALLIAVIATAALAGRQAHEPQPWTPGACYRAATVEGDQVHTLRILEPPRGEWVRVQADPMSPRVPGAGSSRTPVWLNTALVFSLQQIECSAFPRE